MPDRTLAELYAANPFDPVPMRRELGDFYVPFAELVPGSDVEAVLETAMRTSGRRVGVRGPSGCGKSSLISWVSQRVADDVAMIRVPVDAENDETVTDPRAFARHMVEQLSRQAETAQSLTREQGRRSREAAASGARVERRRGIGGRLGLPSWLVNGEVAVDAASVLSIDSHRSATETIGVLSQLGDLLQARGFLPMVVLDDTDAWLDTSVGHRSQLVAPFFGRVLPELVEELQFGWVVAVHDEYLDRDDFPHGAGVLPSYVPVPQLGGRDALSRILERRARTVLGDGALVISRFIQDDALAGLFDAYQSSAGNLRIPMTFAHAALEGAIIDEAEQLSIRHVATAAAQFRTAT